MKTLIITDAWIPQVNGVVRTLTSTITELEKLGHNIHVVSPDQFKNLPCPTYPIEFREFREHRIPGAQYSSPRAQNSGDTILISWQNSGDTILISWVWGRVSGAVRFFQAVFL